MKKIGIVHVGVGLIGKATINNLRLVRQRWRDEYNIDILFRAFIDTSGGVACDEPGGYSDATIDSILQAKTVRQPIIEAARLLGLTPRTARESIDLALTTGPCIVVDAAAGDTSADIAFAAVTNGSGAAFSNKAPLSLPAEDQRSIALWSDATSDGRVRYEATCGAGLPVISTLHSLLDTGDKILEVTGTLSGTLGAILASVDAGSSFSDAVRDASARGYTEPDPRDDLSGLDVARKALILTRTMGRDIDLEDIEIESLVPDSLQTSTVADFLAGIDSLDQQIADRTGDAQQGNSVLKYVARIGREGPIRVGLEPVPKSTVVGSTTGPENVVEIRTNRYDEYPLSVVGPGAGDAVTAAGVTADILTLAKTAGV